MADFLVALAGFDRCRGWEPLGHASLFAFLHVDLGLSRSAAFYRKSAAELLQDFPEVIEPLRDGRLCLSTMAELAKVLTEENKAIVGPRFFGLSAREAQEVVAELQPRHVPSTKMVVTRVLDRSAGHPGNFGPPQFQPAPATTTDQYPNEVPLQRVLTSEPTQSTCGRLAAARDEIEPLTGELRRVHFNVGRQVVKKLEAAREGLSHAIPGATMEQVLDAALDLLLEKQARARGLVKRPRARRPATSPVSLSPTPLAAPTKPGTEPEPETAEPRHRRTGRREPIPAAVRRAVWVRDAGRCSWPLDGGGCCGSTHRLELDHIVPWSEWGSSTVENLRVVCGRHNAMAARQAFGSRCVDRYAVRSPERPHH